MELGEKVRIIRESKGISQKFVSEKLGYKSPSSLSLIESGKREFPSKKIPLIAKILNVPPGEFFEVFFEEKVREMRNYGGGA